MRTPRPDFPEVMLAAATRLFGMRRFHEVRMEDIAAEAQVAKGTLYRYFRDKEELYLALLERASAQFLEQLKKEIGHRQGARARLVVLVRGSIAFFDAQPHVFDLIQRVEALRGSGAGFPWKRVRDEVTAMVQTIFKDGKRLGEFRIRDPEQAALMLLGGLRALVRFGRRPRPKNYAQRLVADFLHGNDQTRGTLRRGRTTSVSA